MHTETVQGALLKSFQLNRNKPAILQAEQALTYAGLLEKANKVTAFLLKKQLGKETMIGISLQNRTELIAAIIGVMNAGCVFVPLDMRLPGNRLGSMIGNLQLDYLITDDAPVLQPGIIEQVTHRFSRSEIQGINIDAVEAQEYPVFDGTDSLYVYFTSGTTGQPKAIMGMNKSLLHFLQWEIKTFNITGNDRFSQFISPYFDALLRDVFTPLLAGACICLPDEDDDALAPEKITAWIEKQQISFIHCVPSLFRNINNEWIHSGSYSSLKYVLMSGEKIIPGELQRWYSIFGAAIQLVNLYGVTETTMIRSYYNIRPEDAQQARIPVGNPIDDTELLILREDMKPCSMLVAGDLYIVSDYTTKGYINDDELNRAKFKEIEIPGKGKVKAYKTGDKARRLANGMIDLMGRDDRQIKIRGLRIELDEIETIFRQSPWVKQVAAGVTSDNDGDPFLAAFVVKNDPQKSDEETTDALRKFLQSNLPDYMIPSLIMIVEAFPLLASGKINYGLLLSTRPETITVAPANETEEKLMAIWKELLGDKVISADASFQTLGGSSLSIMKLIAKIYKVFAVRISLNSLFNHLTIQKQAQLIRAASKDDSLTIPKAAEKPAYYLSAAQERIYYAYELNKNSTAYNLPMAWEIQGSFQEEKIQQAFSGVIKRQESLRTSFKVEQGHLLQVIHSDTAAVIEHIAVEGDDTYEAIHSFIRPFNLGTAPLVRCGILELSGGKTILAMDIHHIICDGMSQQNLYSDFLRLYNGEQLAPLPVQYKDYAEWEYKFKMEHQYISLREFWLKEFELPVPELILPSLTLPDATESEEGGNVYFNISRADCAPVLEMLQTQGITVFSGLFTMFHIFLSQLTGQEDIVIGINTTGRIQEETDGLVGMFAKTLPVRNIMDPAQSFAGFVHQVHQRLIKANSNQLYDLADIVRELKRTQQHLPDELIRVMFVFQNYDRKAVQTNDLAFVHYDVENKTFKYPITLFVAEEPDGFYFRFEYASRYFSRKDAELITQQFSDMVKRISSNLNTPIAEYADTYETSAMPVEEEQIVFKF